jgi:hypothetical protein
MAKVILEMFTLLRELKKRKKKIIVLNNALKHYLFMETLLPIHIILINRHLANH